MSVFHFKKFDVQNSLAAMKVNTDGVLLGVAAPLEVTDRHILDIGTGTGVISLILAQRYDEMRAEAGRNGSVKAEQYEASGIIGIDIDPDAASEAALNFRNSPWASELSAINTSLSEYSGTLEDTNISNRLKFDLIVSNPPYYDNSLVNPDNRKATARHTGDGLSFRELMDFSAKFLSDSGRLSVVLPADQEAALLRYGRMRGLHICRILRIRTVERKSPIRIIASFRKTRSEKIEDGILTLMEKGKYTGQYISLTKDFYLFA